MDDNRVKLTVMGISYTQLKSEAYALILAEEDGPYRIPIVIGEQEAQSIAIRLEGIRPQRPLTHDLFVSFAHAFGVKLKEVFIYRFEDGIFSSEMTFTDGEREVVIDSRTSDAVSIALRTKAPIYTTRQIVEETGFIMEEVDPDDMDDSEFDQSALTENDNLDDIPEPSLEGPKLENYALEELEKTLERLISEENYEEAARVSELIRKKKEGK